MIEHDSLETGKIAQVLVANGVMLSGTVESCDSSMLCLKDGLKVWKIDTSKIVAIAQW